MSQQLPLIQFRIHELRGNDAWGNIRLYFKGELLLDLNDYPIEELSRQLHNWSMVVSDLTPKCFVFEYTDKLLTGTFRVESRPKLWEFTSTKEIKRPANLIELSLYIKMVLNFVNSLSKERL